LQVRRAIRFRQPDFGVRRSDFGNPICKVHRVSGQVRRQPDFAGRSDGEGILDPPGQGLGKGGLTLLVLVTYWLCIG
jgi:hypothetical protein